MHQLEAQEKMPVKTATDIKNISRGHTRVQWVVALAASLTILTYGILAGWMSPMTKVLQSDESPTGQPLTDQEVSSVGSAMALVAMVGVQLYAHLADTIGRKYSVVLIAVPQAICWLIKIYATNTTALILARVVAGIPAGGCFNLVPMYIKEISQDNIRGAVVSMVILMQNVGLFLIYMMGAYLDYYMVLWICFGLSVAAIIALMFAPESPAYLVKKGKLEDAAKTVALLRGLHVDSNSVQGELKIMREQEEQFKSLPALTYIGIFRNIVWRRSFIFITMVALCQSFNGHFTIRTYAWSVLSALGATVNPDLQTLIVPTFETIGAIVSVLCVETLGRKKLLSSTFLLTFVAMACLGTTMVLQNYSICPPAWLPMAAVALDSFAYAAGVTPVIYVVIAEIFNFQVRSKLIGWIVTSMWFVSSMQLSVFQPATQLFGIHTLFYVFAGVNLIGAINTLVLLPETKGKSSEQIEEEIANKSIP
ncbi:hypothetical protein ACJJTC_000910 [Scirpophaga incertulas]